MSHGLKLTKIRIGPVVNLDDAVNAIRDLESQLNIIVQALQTPDAGPAVGEVKAFFREDDGSYHLYSLVAGAGVTITPDTAAKTLTFTSP